ncbi:MAG: hypothetical protein EOT04_00390 [Candidatus Chaera renei]|uniref:Uncharacterized protein n=1 Tax=Candidatus Chaera renei TaxID=2506947 RepID=A0A4Q0AJU9_9BACT|nr:MAG: hypothetical protein EOT04_00390 [Candidatus Chaera renei]
MNTLPAALKERWQKYEHKKGAKVTAAVAVLGVAAVGLYMLSKYGTASSGQAGARAQEAFDGSGMSGGRQAHMLSQELGGNLPGGAGTAGAETMAGPAVFGPEHIAQASTRVARPGDNLWDISEQLLKKAGVHADNATVNAVKNALVQSNHTFGPDHQIWTDQVIDLRKGWEVVDRLKRS